MSVIEDITKGIVKSCKDNNETVISREDIAVNFIDGWAEEIVNEIAEKLSASGIEVVD